MPKEENLRETKQHGAAWFPFNIYPCTIPKDFPQVALHWQDSMELVFVKKGRGIVQAGLTSYTADCLMRPTPRYFDREAVAQEVNSTAASNK